jgi:uncharacterized membrane protein YfcA
LGMFGSGGSILTVPILVYLLQVNPVEATTYNLFVVGITSAIGFGTYFRKNLVDVRIAIFFAIPSIASVFIMRKFMLPNIPESVIKFGDVVVSKNEFIMILYGILMVAAAASMIWQSGIKENTGHEFKPVRYLELFALGSISGILTGMFGMGGGFIIIPALVLFARVPILMSVGTSLLIIAFNSLSGFGVEVFSRHNGMDYHLIFLFTLLAITGLFIGLSFSLKLYPAQMKKLFGWFILVMASGIFVKEIFFK